MRMIDDDEIGLKENQNTLYVQKGYIKLRTETPGVWLKLNTKDLIPYCMPSA